MNRTAKMTIALDEENYGIDFIKGNSYSIREDENGYYCETESGSNTLISEDELEIYFE